MDKTLKKVSVIMSTYNSELEVSEAIESILTQSYKNIEFLIIDDCSTDNTFKILQEYSINNEKIKIFRNKSNIGLTRSLNLLISKADGDIIARQDDDDTSHPNRIKSQVEKIEKGDLDFALPEHIKNQTKEKFQVFLLPSC